MSRDAVALDADAFTFLMQANTGYDPTQDSDVKVAMERVAVFRVFLHVERIIALPKVKSQVARIPHGDFRTVHRGFLRVHLEEPQVDDAAATARAKELGEYHQAREGAEKRRREEDCRVVAEAELAEVDALLTFYKTLQKDLGSHARLRLLAPLEYWTALGIPRGATPVRVPDKTHPLYSADWWRW